MNGQTECPAGTTTFDCVAKIGRSKSIDEVKSNIIAFLDFINLNKKHKSQLCEQLVQVLLKVGNPYLSPLPTQNKNVVYIPPEVAPILMIMNCVSISGGDELMLEGLNKYVARCGEFSEPMETRITETEMDMVLETAQKKFKILDIIAKFKPLKVVSLKNSHYIHNCECGISASFLSREAMIFVYHPREVSIYDRVFIFAHEIGHALHLALTGDVNIIPDKFDTFNEALGVKGLTQKEKQECFADAVAIAILNSDGLNEHLPAEMLKQALPYFDRYIEYVTGEYLKLPF